MWKAIVSFLKWKPMSTLPLVVLATGLILLLIPLGFVVYQLGHQVIPGSASNTSSMNQELQQTQNANLGQHNLLLVLVDRLDQPNLEGVWLVVNGNLNNGSKFLPVEFAAPANTNESAEDSSSSNLFTIDGSPTAIFVNDLIDRGLWWDYYLVIDQSGLGALTGWSGRSSSQDFPSPSSGTEGDLNTDNLADPQGFYQQAASLKTLCERSELINQTLDPGTILSLLEGHFRTDYDLSRLTEEWYSFRHRGFAWYCEFPTIKEISFLEFDNSSE
ncbi:MAG: hypothetical protein A2Z16_04300 [Chloroflexi bacterium RBG_16_54_18]|nr:MAG: hypothetical protein A2Z16_04300 [Chloroflexi bacterium RBG_16_54_18]